MTERGYKILPLVKTDFALMLADDEVPSVPLWEFAPPAPARYGVPIIPILGDKMHVGHVGVQERLVWVDGWRWVGREVDGKKTLFEGHSESPVPLVPLLVDLPDGTRANAGILLWHYLLEAPLEEREAKAQRYTSFDPYGDHRSRLFPKDDELVPIAADLRRYLR
jgi:hypothetical protein